MKNWDIHPEAELELEEAFVHYLGIDPKLAISFEVTFFNCLDRIVASKKLF